MIEIHPKLYWEHLGVAGALAISVFVLAGLALRLRDASPPRMHLWAMVAFFVVNSLDQVNSLAYSDIFDSIDALFLWNDVLVPGFLVALYFYVRSLTSSNPKLTRRDWVHVLPFVIGFLFLLPAFNLTGAQRRDILSAQLSEDDLLLVALGEFAFRCMWVVLLAVYGTFCIRRLIAHRRNIRAVFSDLDGKTLRWLDFLVATIFVLTGIVIVDEIRIITGFSPIRDGISSMCFDILLAGLFGVFALRAEPPLPRWSEDVLATPAPLPATTDEATRYARSGLQPDDLDRFAARLEQRMADGQLWRDHGLNLRGLAAAAALSPIHLSEVLNTRLGLSFYDYVNQCRVRDACELLIQSDASILEISETVGFNAKSTFNTSFRKVTDQTPSQWRRSHQP